MSAPLPTPPYTLEQLNAAPLEVAAQMLDGLYEHSPWIAQQALTLRPFASLAALQVAMTRVLDAAGREPQLALIRAHPELAGKAMVSNTLTAESTHEQSQAGLTHCTPDEFARIQQLNADYNARFGFPFILAVRGPRGTGLDKQTIIDTFTRRLQQPVEAELQECLRNIHRIVEIRLHDKFGVEPTLGHEVWDWHAQLAQFSEAPDALTVTYMTDAHQSCARWLADVMRDCGLDEVEVDAVGNVVGRYRGTEPGARWLLTGSHYDTVRNAGRYDGRLGILAPLMALRELARQGRRLPFGVELVAFSEEEGQRYPATFLGSGALVGEFDPAWLDLVDASGIALRDALRQAGHDPAAIPALERDPTQYLGFVEVHIEQGPVLTQRHLPLGIVSSINGSLRYVGEVIGTASHAGTTPMGQRHDAACAVAELMLYAEQRAAQDGDSVATVGQLHVPGGSVNVVPGRCQFSLDVRAPSDDQRDALAHDILAELERIATRRQVQFELRETLRAAAAPSDATWQARWTQAVTALGLPAYTLPSGAGHDAMKLHQRLPQAMLFVRGQNGGISHNPLESTTSADMQLAVEAFAHLLNQLA